MAYRAEKLKSDLIDRVAALVRDRLGPDKAGPAEEFVRRYYANVALDDLRRETVETLYGAALSIWGFGSRRKPGTAKLRVYNPRFEDAGWQSSHTVIEIVNDDMPFLVDSVAGELNRRDLMVQIIVHPIVRVRRDSGGRLVGLVTGDEAPEGSILESFMHVEISEQPADAHEEIRAALETVLAAVRVVVEDWRPMRARVDEILAELKAARPPVPEAELAEVTAFLEWIRENHFTFLGARDYVLVVEDGRSYHRPIPGSGLGQLREISPESAARHAAPLSPQVADFARRKELLIIAKADTRSLVHRPVPMDFIGVRRFAETGEVVGEHRIVGLFSSTAYNQSPRYIPVLRRKVEQTIARAGFSPASHDGKALLHILETFPRDELFQISDDELYETALGILQLQERQRVALFVRCDPFGRYVSCLVFAPRERYGTDLRQRFQKVLEDAFQGTVSSFYTHLGDEPLARIHFIITTAEGRIPDFDADEIEARLVEVSRSWRDRLQEALIQEKGEARGLQLLRCYGDAFDAGYRERFDARAAVFDIDKVEEVYATGALGIHLSREIEAPECEARLKIYHADEPVPLSDLLPMLEHMGFKVISEIPFAVTPEGGERPVWIHDLVMRTADGAAVDVAGVKEKFRDCLSRVWTGEVDDDGFNRLVAAAGLTWREVVVLRAYCKYLRQARIAFSEAYMQQTLTNNPALARLIVELFAARFDPKRGRRGQRRAAELEAEIEEALEGVANLDEDRILRRFLNLVLATLRTNYFQRTDAGGPKPYLSFKLDGGALDELPLPRPMYEIFVYSPRTEAVHLRGGKVARGGVRWSDRREDFRTEILGLMKAQMVKNAVIVPVGSKGGFVVKRPPPPGAGREALGDEVVACYQTMMRGLLDLTDNLKGGTVVPPPDVVRFDDDDPYLVVAADKGTASFSDIANAIAEEYGFWLGDAFASGGSAGYDHKKMGITARGAWESVKRHFREMGIDVQNQDFTVIGVGDMSGDVFGNGMLLSEHIKLVGAFNHLHIFVDPDPDPATSFEERRRLFALPRSSWGDYDRKLISEGGGVFDRSAKAVKLTPQMKALFGIDADSVTPAALIQAMLRAEVDLLWFGGIGTFVKASDETHAEAGDRANDAVRVNAGELRARVVGEGANLAVTQRGRIEYALAGGRINTDAIDNSAGVDTSDHEVNIKILLDDVVARGDMTRKQRDTLLKRMTDEVAGLVLRHNYLQTQAISIAEARGSDVLDRDARLIRSLERAGKLDRAIEFLPDDEGLTERLCAKRGLTRPEIAVLLAYAKIALYDELLPSTLPDDPLFLHDLTLYFPKPLHRRYKAAIARHPLRREIIVTAVTNSMVNRLGHAFVNEMREQTGLGADDIARAYAVTRDVFGLRTLWEEIEALDNKVPASVQTAMAIRIIGLVERCTLWFLRHGPRPLDVSATCAEFGAAVAKIAGCLEDILAAEEKEELARRAAELVEQKVPDSLARRIAALDVLGSALDIVRIALAARLPVEPVGRTYFAIGARFGLDWLRGAAAGLGADSEWQKQALSAIVEDLYGHQSELTARILEASGGVEIADEMIAAWIAARRHAVERTERVLSDLRSAPSVDLAMLTVANREIRAMLGG